MNYLGADVRRTRTDFVEPQRTNVPRKEHRIRVYDARPIADSLSLEVEGFALLRNPSRVALDPALMDAHQKRRLDAAPITHAYWDEIVPLIKEVSGAREVIPQPGGVTARRSAKAREQGWVAQVGLAHADVTPLSIEGFLPKALDDLGLTVKPYSRIVFYQTWQVVSPPPHDSTLAFVDSRTVKNTDFIINDCHFGTSNTVLDDFESRVARYSPDHRWYYFSDIRPDELLVFKGYDSANTDGDNYIHGAIDNPAADVLPRSSIEARYLALFD